LGDPQLSLLPLEVLHKAAEECFNNKDPQFLQYGIEQGDGNFRQSLATFLTRAYQYPVEPDDLFTTNGASMGLHLTCSMFTRPGDTVFVEEPTYFLALRIFADHNLKVVPVCTDDNGLVIEDLEEKLVESNPKFLYIIPTYQNPSGQTMPDERRKRLVELCHQQGLLIIADEVYHSLGFSGTSPRPFAADVNNGKIISLGSFSKILAPGLRLGWIQSDGKTIRRFTGSGLLDSGGGMNPFTSAIVRQVIEEGSLERNITHLIETYRERANVMDEVLRNNLPELKYIKPGGGYFFWLQLPDEVNAVDLQERAKDFKVGFRSGMLFSCRNRMQDHLRVSYVFYESGELEQGLIRLKQSLESL
jgi:2-aminoadipate transaminase